MATIADACFSGFAIVRDSGATPPLTDDYVAAAVREPVVQVITAGRRGEQALEERGHAPRG